MFGDIHGYVQLRQVERGKRADWISIVWVCANDVPCMRLPPATQSLYGPYGPPLGTIDVGVPDWQPGIGSYSE